VSIVYIFVPQSIRAGPPATNHHDQATAVTFLAENGCQ
jgi:hypothetical protein